MADQCIDTNVYLSRWPFRRVHGDEPVDLMNLLRETGVTEAWAGSFDGVLHKDIAGVNARLADECGAHGDGLLMPMGSVNPMLPRWENDLDRCGSDHGMRGIRLHPNYHGYDLADGRFAELLHGAAERNLAVQIVLTMEDERMMHPLLRVPHVDATPLLDMTLSAPVMLLNAFRAVRGETLARLANRGDVLFDLSWLEGAAGITRHLKLGPVESLCFGSYAPLFYVQSAALKMMESPLDLNQREAILWKNAERFLSKE